MMLPSLQKELKHLFVKVVLGSKDESTTIIAEKTIQDFCELLKKEANAGLRMEYADVVAGYQTDFIDLRRRKFILMSKKKKKRKVEELLARVEHSQKIYSHRSLDLEREQDLENQGLWASLDAKWALRPTTEVARRLFEGDARSSANTGSCSRDFALSEDEVNYILVKEYHSIMRRAEFPRLTQRNAASEEFDPDVSLWSEVKEMGKGAHGRVYTILMKDPQIQDASNAVYVVKEMKYSTAKQKSIMANECELLSRSKDYTHIVSLITYRFWTGMGNIFMEYVSGGDLNKMVEYVGPIAGREGRPMLRQLLNGLCFLHDKQIVHRDLKASNVLISLHGCIKIGDLSCAKDVSHARNRTVLDDVNSRVGTTFWMSPESARGQELQAQNPFGADIWSFGCIIVELMSGARPWPSYHNSENDLRSKLSLMGSEGCPIEGPPLSDDLISAEGRQVLESIFGIAESRPTAEALLENVWLRGFMGY